MILTHLTPWTISAVSTSWTERRVERRARRRAIRRMARRYRKPVTPRAEA